MQNVERNPGKLTAPEIFPRFIPAFFFKAIFLKKRKACGWINPAVKQLNP